MKEFDHTGLLMAEYQAKLFEKSVELGCSSAVFLRRFLHSEHLKVMDENNPAFLTLDPCDGIYEITQQFGEPKCGQVKYSTNELFWMGYIYRYIAYTREESTRFLMKTFPHKQLHNVYPAYHTQDPEWCVASLLDLNGLNEKFFDKNYRLKEIMRKYYSELSL